MCVVMQRVKIVGDIKSVNPNIPMLALALVDHHGGRLRDAQSVSVMYADT